MKAARSTVISVGANPELLWLRNFVLQSAGFDVITTTNDRDVLARIERGECGVLLLCYSTAKAIRQELAAALRRFCHGSEIVAITNERIEKPDFADSFVYGVEGPEALIQALTNAAEKSQSAGMPRGSLR
ncbi:MAG TPA: hypothetical protein VJS37_00770 [Terriglobales bacterium]|nr:hypothetical protein [Terriglobales bacterium]